MKAESKDPKQVDGEKEVKGVKKQKIDSESEWDSDKYSSSHEEKREKPEFEFDFAMLYYVLDPIVDIFHQLK